MATNVDTSDQNQLPASAPAPAAPAPEPAAPPSWSSRTSIFFAAYIIGFYVISTQDSYWAKVVGSVLVFVFVTVGEGYYCLYLYFRRATAKKKKRVCSGCVFLCVVIWICHTVLGMFWVYLVYAVKKEVDPSPTAATPPPPARVDPLFSLKMAFLKNLLCVVALVYNLYAIVLYYLYNHPVHTTEFLRFTLSLFNRWGCCTCCNTYFEPRNPSLLQLLAWKAKVKMKIEEDQRRAIDAQTVRDNEAISDAWAEMV